MPRKYTNKLIELAEQGIIDWKDVTKYCLSYMSESEVEDLFTSEGFIDELDEEE